MKKLLENWKKYVAEDLQVKIKKEQEQEKVDLQKCPPATQDLKLNTKNRDATIKQYNYGPLNVDEPGDYWEKIAEYWKTTEKAAKKSLCGNCVAFDISPRMKDCLPGDTFDEDGELGYCWMHHFKCHSARACHTWAKGGPIEKNDESAEWQEKNKKSLEEESADKKMSPEQAIAKEGGALGFSKWEELTGMTRDELEKYVKDNDHIKIHKHGDIIDAKGLSEDIELVEDVVVDEGKICAKGKAWAMRKYGKWSAYAAMGASRYCKEPGWGKGKKKKKKKKKRKKRKNESLDSAEMQECWSTHERVPGTKKGAKGSCRPKTNESESVRDTYDDEVVQRNKKSREAGAKVLMKKEGELKKWRDEKWVQSDGTPCGDAKKQKNPKRCKPKSKWATMSKGEKAADNRKKKAGGKKGKQFVSATKKGKVTKSHTKESKNMKVAKNLLEQIIAEEIDAVLTEYENQYYEMLAEGESLEEAEYQGRKVTLNKPMRGDVKKSKVYVKNAKGNVVKVNFGDKKMKIKKSNPKRRKSFRARHNCKNPGPKWKARYWSCKAW